MFTSEQIDRLLAARTISDQPPWCAGDREQIEQHLKTICSKIEQNANAHSRIEWNHYGSGYASYVDAWFYRPEPDFQLPDHTSGYSAYAGLVVCFSRLAPYFVLMEGDKRWDKTSSGGYLPGWEMVDEFCFPSVARLAAEIGQMLEWNSFIRLSRDQLAAELHPDYQVPTLLSERPFRMFDALFYWED